MKKWMVFIILVPLVRSDDLDYLAELEAFASNIEQTEHSEWLLWQEKSRYFLKLFRHHDYILYQKFYQLPERYRVEILKWAASQSSIDFIQLEKMIKKRQSIIVIY